MAACGPQTADLPEPLAVLNAAADNIHAAESFRIEVIREGAPYFIETDVTDDALLFNRATINYVAPDALEGQVRARLLGVPFNLNILARGDLQWVQLPGAPWTDQLYFAPGFNPQDLIAEESGFQAALNALIDIEMVGQERLEDGTTVYHLTGQAEGPAVSDLVVGLIEADEEVLVDAYIRVEDNMPVRLVLTMPNTVSETEPDPTQWVVDVYDFNAEITITDPDA